jgi:hypothetical protein
LLHFRHFASKLFPYPRGNGGPINNGGCHLDYLL